MKILSIINETEVSKWEWNTYARFPGLAYPCRMQHEAKKTLSINKASFLILKVITIGGTSLDFKIVYQKVSSIEISKDRLVASYLVSHVQRRSQPISSQSQTLNTPLSTIEKFPIMDSFEDSIVSR